MSVYRPLFPLGHPATINGLKWTHQRVTRFAVASAQWVAHRVVSTAAAAIPAQDKSSLVAKSAVLHRSIKVPPLQVVEAKGNRMRFSNGHEVEDTTCGASVACLGHGNERVRQAMIDQMENFYYCNSMFFGHQVGEDLATELINGTGGAMAKAYIMSSGMLYPRHTKNVTN